MLHSSNWTTRLLNWTTSVSFLDAAIYVANLK